MNKKSFKKFVALLTATTLLLSTSMMAFAAETPDNATDASGTVSGNGTVEDYLNKDVFKVTLPVVSNVDFTIDPQGLLGVADDDVYTLGAGAVYFKNVSGNSVVSYSGSSDAIEIGNKSSYDVDVSLTVNLTAADGINMVETAEDLEDATEPSLYLAIKEADDAEATAITKESTDLAVKVVEGIDEAEDAYKIKAESDGQGGWTYSYILSPDYDGTPDAASYVLSGACDETADWSDVKDLTVKADLVWNVTKHSERQDVLTTDGSQSVKVYLTDVASISTATLTPVSIAGSNKAAINLMQNDLFTYTDGCFALEQSFCNTLATSSSRGAGTYKLTINGSIVYTITVE